MNFCCSTVTGTLDVRLFAGHRLWLIIAEILDFFSAARIFHNDFITFWLEKHVQISSGIWKVPFLWLQVFNGSLQSKRMALNCNYKEQENFHCDFFLDVKNMLPDSYIFPSLCHSRRFLGLLFDNKICWWWQILCKHVGTVSSINVIYGIYKL